MAALDARHEELQEEANDARAKAEEVRELAQVVIDAHEAAVGHHANTVAIREQVMACGACCERPELVKRLDDLVELTGGVTENCKRKRDVLEAELAQCVADRDRKRSAVDAHESSERIRLEATPVGLKELYALVGPRDAEAVRTALRFPTTSTKNDARVHLADLEKIACTLYLPATMHLRDEYDDPNRMTTLTIHLRSRRGTEEYYVWHLFIRDSGMHSTVMDTEPDETVRTISRIAFYYRGDHILTLTRDSRKGEIESKCMAAMCHHEGVLFAPPNPRHDGDHYHRFVLLLLETFPYHCLDGVLQYRMDRASELACLFTSTPILLPRKS